MKLQEEIRKLRDKNHALKHGQNPSQPQTAKIQKGKNKPKKSEEEMVNDKQAHLVVSLGELVGSLEAKTNLFNTRNYQRWKGICIKRL